MPAVALASSAVAYHDQLASGWDDRYRSGGFRRRAGFFAGAILPRLSTAGRSWADVGCGSGYFARALCRRGARVIGLDGSAAMVEAARRAADQGNRTLSFEAVETVERLPLADASVDGCLCLSVLEYLDDPGACLAEMARVTKRGGRVVTSTPDPRSIVRRAQRWRRTSRREEVSSSADYLESSRRSWTPVELETWAAGFGLSPVFSAGFDPVLPRPLWPLAVASLRFVIWSRGEGRA